MWIFQWIPRKQNRKSRDKPLSLDFLLFAHTVRGWTYSSCTVKILMRGRNFTCSGISYISCLSFLILPPSFFTFDEGNRQHLISKEIVRFVEMPRCLGQMDHLNNLVPKMIKRIMNSCVREKYGNYFKLIV